MNWLNGWDGRVDRDVPLSDLTWFGLGGKARYLARPTGAGRLGKLLHRALEHGVGVKVLGGGANVLIRDDGFDGLVVRLDKPSFQMIEAQGQWLRAGCGVDLMQLVQRCSRLGMAGLECLAGIPGTVGGAIRMNAGGRYGEIADSVETVEVLTTGRDAQTLTKNQVGFDYRQTKLGDSIVTAVTFRLEPGDPEEVYARFKRIWRAKKAAQPMADRSAGCIFANPPGDSAGRLIDRAGLKGMTHGRARVSSRHANFILADGGASASDVLHLIDRIRNTVCERFGTELKLEIDIW
jgi:UDP-N-acetylmuramate dehydrogenase